MRNEITLLGTHHIRTNTTSRPIFDDIFRVTLLLLADAYALQVFVIEFVIVTVLLAEF